MHAHACMLQDPTPVMVAGCDTYFCEDVDTLKAVGDCTRPN